VVGHLGEEDVVDLARLAADQRHQAGALQPGRLLDPGQLADRRVDVEVADEAVEDAAAEEAAGAAHDHHHPDPAVIQGRLRVGEGEAVVGGADDQGAVLEPALVEAVEDGADPLVERAGAGLEGGHVGAGLRRVRQVRRRQRVERVADRGRDPVGAVGLEEADRHEEGLLGGAEALDRGRGDVGGVVAVDLDHLLVADHLRVLGDVLLADQDRAVAGLMQRMDEVLAIVVELPAAVGEAQQAVVVAVLAREQGGAAARAGRRCAEGVAEEHPLVSEQLDVRRRHRKAVGLDVAAGVVGVDVEDVWQLVDKESIQF
jgi:hypothetical protein